MGTELEMLAMELHEAGRAAVEAGATVAAEKFGEKTRKFLEWDELTEPAREGRRIQARYLLERFEIKRINKEGEVGMRNEILSNDRFNFGQAIEEMKKGLAVAREGWNGKGIFIAIASPNFCNSHREDAMTQDFIFIDTTGLITNNNKAPKCRVPWFASQTDMLAEDWVVSHDMQGGDL